VSGAAAFLARRRRWIRIAFWATAVFAFAMAIDPHPPQIPGEPGDKVEHMLAFATLAALAAAGWPERRYAALALALSYFGAIIEIVQAIPALHRDCDIMDWVADTAALSLVLALASLVRRAARPRG
jgi:F0F1-type ATP synthase membrane subunit a